MEREVELEHRAVESSTALARIQVTSALTNVKLLWINIPLHRSHQFYMGSTGFGGDS